MNETFVAVKDNTANPAPLGLIGFGLTTILLNIHNAGFYPLNSMIMGMGIFVGGLAQVVAGILEARKNNTFGTTAFTAYGFFWLSLVAVWVMPSLGVAEKASSFSMGFYLLLWGLFTLGLFLGTFKMTRVHQIIFGSLALLFFLLAAGDFTGISLIKVIAGFVGIICGLSAFYGCIAQVLNEVYGKTVLPMDRFPALKVLAAAISE